MEIHLVKESQIISKDAKSQAKLIHGIQLVLARNYSENLREEVKKGMREKAEQGIYPGRAPVGYKNNSATRNIEIDPEKSVFVKKAFEFYGTGNYSLSSLRKTLWTETGVKMSKAHLDKLLQNRFYVGYFVWQNIEYKGTHQPLIDLPTFQRIQDVFSGRAKPKHRKHNFAFSGLLTCEHDGCTVTSELHKGKYVYYRCSDGRGKCDLPYMPEPKISDQLGDVLKDIYVPDHVVQAIVNSIEADRHSSDSKRQEQLAGLQQQLAMLRTRMDQMYEDKLDGKIDEEFWSRKMAEWRARENALQTAVDRLSLPITQEHVLSVQRILELANKAHYLYFTRNAAERGQLLKMVL